MRIHLDLLSQEDHPSIPVNYNHLLSRAIIKTLSPAEPEYERFSRAKGLRGQHNKRFKLFTFSGLQFHGPRWTLEEGTFRFSEPPQAKLILSFPHDESFIKESIIPLLLQGTIQISAPVGVTRFKVAALEQRPFPQLHPGTYLAITPITISRRVNDEIRYLSPRNRETSIALADNLVEKHEMLTGEQIPREAVQLRVDPEYLARAVHPIKVLTLYEGTPDATRVRSFIAPIRITGDSRLIRTAFACGVGERNSLGFGLLAEPVTAKARRARKAVHG